MRTILVVLLIVATAVMVVGVANHARAADVGYLFGTWEQASFVALAAIVAGLVLCTGLVVAVLSASFARRDRRKLETELEETYGRLRAAEALLPDDVVTGIPSPAADGRPVTHDAAAAVAPAAGTEPDEVAPEVTGGGDAGHGVTLAAHAPDDAAPAGDDPDEITPAGDAPDTAAPAEPSAAVDDGTAGDRP